MCARLQGQEGERNWVEAREFWSSISKTLSRRREGPGEERHAHPSEVRKRLEVGGCGGGRGGPGRMTLQTRGAVEEAVSGSQRRI